eukprot:1788147-Pyramimonas_sp.AAC.1
MAKKRGLESQRDTSSTDRSGCLGSLTLCYTYVRWTPSVKKNRRSWDFQLEETWFLPLVGQCICVLRNTLSPLFTFGIRDWGPTGASSSDGPINLLYR